MKYSLLFLICCIATLNSNGQIAQTTVQEAVDAENAFAALSKEKNTREAFLTHLNDSAIVFDRSNPVIGKELWEKRKADNSLLYWWPVFSDIAASGNFAYNTGPFEWSKDRDGSKPVAYGYFSSVWKRGVAGRWQVVIDMGMTLPAAETKSETWSTSKNKPLMAKGVNGYADAKMKFLKHDAAYITELNNKTVSFLPSFFSDESRLHHTNHFPVISLDAIRDYKDSREKYAFEQLGGDIASSNDLAYAYGRVKAINKSDQKPVTFNYLRIWKKEKGTQWKIVLDVIGG